MAKIRTAFKREVEELLPFLHDTYRRVGRCQKRGDPAAAEDLEGALDLVATKLQFFKQFMQREKQPYFEVLQDTELGLSDRIIALDTAVGAMHIEFAMERAYMHKESEPLRRALDEIRMSGTEEIARNASPAVLVSGIAASPGMATGRAILVTRNSDYRRMPGGSVVVARMTRPEIVMSIDKVAAIVTDVGGALSHAAIVAREKGVPCIVGTGNATLVISPRRFVTVDGCSGVVRNAE